ncbi:MAG: hypothetical protein ACLTMP_08855 [Eggerthella lenta]
MELATRPVPVLGRHGRRRVRDGGGAVPDRPDIMPDRVRVDVAASSLAVGLLLLLSELVTPLRAC